MSWITVGVGVASVATSIFSGISGSKNAKKQAAAEAQMRAEQMALMREHQAKFQRLIDGYPKQTQEFLSKISATYAQLNHLTTEAKNQGDEQAAAIFQAQRDMVDTHLDAELEAIGANKTEILGALNSMADDAVKLVMQDEDMKDKLRADYKKEADLAVGNLRKMAEASGSRIDTILKTGMAPDAAAKLSQIRQGVADLTRKTAEVEAARGKGGAASRTTATELEGLKVLGEATANLRSQAMGELAQAGNQQAQLQGAASNRMMGLQPTRGAAELAARAPYQQLAAAQTMQSGEQGLTAMGNAAARTRTLTGAEGEASMAREQQYSRDRMSLVSGQNAAEMGAKEREQDLIAGATTQSAVQARSMADIMGVQAQNYANMAKESSAAAMQGFSLAARTGAGMIGGYSQTGTWAGAGQGGMFGGFGIGSMPTAAPKATGNPNAFMQQEGYPSPFMVQPTYGPAR